MNHNLQNIDIIINCRRPADELHKEQQVNKRFAYSNNWLAFYLSNLSHLLGPNKLRVKTWRGPIHQIART